MDTSVYHQNQILRSISIAIFSLLLFNSGILFAQQQAFTTVGTFSYTVPASVIELTAEAIGGGGGGGLVRGSSERESGGGGGGAYAKGKVVVTPNAQYTVGVGNFGKKERGDSDARNGGDSYFNSDTSTDASTTVRAQGGQTLLHNDNSDPNGKPGGQASASVGNIATWSGGTGGTTNSNNFGGGGGGAAGSLGAGGNGGQFTAGVRGLGDLLNNDAPGNGGVGGVDNGDDTGTPGSLYGGGGGGARKSASGNSSTRNGEPGASGIVVLTWSEVTSLSSSSLCTGDTVTITGTGFTNVTDVKFNGVAATFTTLNTTQISTSLPLGATSGDIVVTTEYGKAKIAYTASNATVWYADTDGDTFGNPTDSTFACTQPTGYVANNSDCNDANALINPATIWYADTDGDTYGNPTDSTSSCSQPTGYVANNSDCNDADASVTLVCNPSSVLTMESSKTAFEIYPNPSSGILWIENEAEESFNVEIYDVAGKQVELKKSNNASSQGKVLLDVSSLSNSVYQVKLTCAKGTVIKRLLKN